MTESHSTAEIVALPKFGQGSLPAAPPLARISVMPKRSATLSRTRGPYGRSPKSGGAATPPALFLKEWRLFFEMTQGDLAEATGLSVGFISSIERGEEAPSMETVQKLADALGITRGQLIDVNPMAAGEPLWRLLVDASADQIQEIAEHAEVIVRRKRPKPK